MMSISRFIHGMFFSGYEEEYQRIRIKLEEERVLCKEQVERNVELQDEVASSELKIKSLEELFLDGWVNIYSWRIYDGNFQTITGAKVPPNTFITSNDREIKKAIIKYALKKDNVYDTAKVVQDFIYKYVGYVYDHQNQWHPDYIEFFQTASFTWQVRLGDCDDFAILFNTIMHICGYGDLVVSCCGLITGSDGNDYGHAFNMVRHEDNWVVFDSQIGERNKSKITYPTLEECWFFFNSWGSYTC